MSKCKLCDSPENNKIKYGEMYPLNDTSVHLFCLLLSPGLCQRGADGEGVQGFLPKDILKESKRVKALTCCYCHKKHANLGCSIKSCRRRFHISCGIEHGASFEFTENFPTFCSAHIKHKQEEVPNITECCGICLELLSTEKKSILIPCCKNSWFHLSCLQSYSYSAGIYFKCPVCNDKDACSSELIKLGVFLPTKDAEWELETDAFHDLAELPEKTCESDFCKNEECEGYKLSPWLWDVCEICGACAIHKACRRPLSNLEFVCYCCEEILLKKEAAVSVENASPQQGCSHSTRKSSDDSPQTSKAWTRKSSEHLSQTSKDSPQASGDSIQNSTQRSLNNSFSSLLLKSSKKISLCSSDDERTSDIENTIKENKDQGQTRKRKMQSPEKCRPSTSKESQTPKNPTKESKRKRTRRIFK